MMGKIPRIYERNTFKLGPFGKMQYIHIAGGRAGVFGVNMKISDKFHCLWYILPHL
jgi:hypothetical protein